MNETYKLFRSRTFWTLVFMSLIPVANAIVPTLAPAGQAFAEIILGILATYFHNETAKNVGAAN